MFSQELLNTFKQKIDNAKTIAIFGHENVDGDAVGSMLGLGKICEKLGKEVGYFTTVTPAKSFAFLSDIQKIRTDFDHSDSWDLIIFVDFNNYKRIGKITEGHEAYFDGKEKLIIDHHIGDENYPHAILLKDTVASSNCELLFEICKEVYPELLDNDIATYFYLGLMTDTGNFQYETDTVRTMNNAIELIKLGAKKAWLIHKVFNSSEWTTIDLLKMIIPRIGRNSHVCYAWYTVDEIEKLGFSKDDADVMIFANIKPIKDMPVFAILRAGNDGKVGISLRSGYMANDSRINVQLIASAIGGGGHMYAAGCKVPLKDNFEQQVPEIIAQINAEIEKQL